MSAHQIRTYVTKFFQKVDVRRLIQARSRCTCSRCVSYARHAEPLGSKPEGSLFKSLPLASRPRRARSQNHRDRRIVHRLAARAAGQDSRLTRNVAGYDRKHPRRQDASLHAAHGRQAARGQTLRWLRRATRTAGGTLRHGYTARPTTFSFVRSFSK